MKKATAQAEQFFQRAGNQSTKGSRTGVNLLGWGEDVLDHLTDEEKRDSLKRHLEYLKPLKGDEKKGGPIGQEIAKTMLAIAELRPRIQSANAKTIPNIFMDICRERMTPLEFKRILDEANNRQRGGVNIEAVKRLLTKP